MVDPLSNKQIFQNPQSETVTNEYCITYNKKNPFCYEIHYIFEWKGCFFELCVTGKKG